MAKTVGMVRVFQSPYEQYRARNGQLCQVMRRLTSTEKDAEVGVMYKVKFNDKVVIDAWPKVDLFVDQYTEATR